ncbi:MAG: hypothetical protein LBQ79_14675 [Deltaproteobacteria bacterium]|jgi:hypothetical protein|nr:hypothetical protein [Deltaproteobacteria bacterium]
MTGVPLALMGFLLASSVLAALSYRKLAAERQRCLNSFARLDVLLKRLCERMEPGPSPEAAGDPGPAEAKLVRARADFQRARLAASAVLLGVTGAHPCGRTVAEVARAFADLDRAAGRLPPPEGTDAEELAEARLRAARALGTFNGSAGAYNRARRAVPFVLFTRLFGFRKAYPYPLPGEERDREVQL